jgi:ABC-type glycerol-3-phosphate transport system permease component
MSSRAVATRPAERRLGVAVGGRRLGLAATHLVLAVGGLMMMLPFFWLISSSLKMPHEIFVLPPKFVPSVVRWENYVEIMVDQPFLRFTGNTLIVTLPSTLGQVLTAGLAAYGFARLRFAGRDQVFAVLLATIMLPYAVTLIPVYILFKQVGWLGTFWPLIVPFWFGGGAFNIFLLRQFFLTIPNELEEAALIDGAGYVTIFARIVLPLSVPALIVVTIFPSCTTGTTSWRR